MKKYALYEKSNPEETLSTTTLLGLVSETDWSNEEFETISRLAKGRKQEFGNLVVKRVA